MVQNWTYNCTARVEHFLLSPWKGHVWAEDPLKKQATSFDSSDRGQQVAAPHFSTLFFLGSPLEICLARCWALGTWFDFPAQRSCGSPRCLFLYLSMVFDISTCSAINGWLCLEQIWSDLLNIRVRGMQFRGMILLFFHSPIFCEVPKSSRVPFRVPKSLSYVFFFTTSSGLIPSNSELFRKSLSCRIWQIRGDRGIPTFFCQLLFRSF